MKKLFAVLAALTILSGCSSSTSSAGSSSSGNTTPSMDPAASVKKIKENVQSTLGQIELRDQNLQDLANGEEK